MAIVKLDKQDEKVPRRDEVERKCLSPVDRIQKNSKMAIYLHENFEFLLSSARAPMDDQSNRILAYYKQWLY